MLDPSEAGSAIRERVFEQSSSFEQNRFKRLNAQPDDQSIGPPDSLRILSQRLGKSENVLIGQRALL